MFCLNEIIELNLGIYNKDVDYTKRVLNRIITNGHFHIDRSIDDEFMRTALHAAIESDSVELVKVILAWQPSLTLCDSLGRTPLLIAIDRNTENALTIATYLKRQGADTNDCGSMPQWQSQTPVSKFSPIHVATLRNNVSMIDFLFSNRADINAIKKPGRNLYDYFAPDRYSTCNKELTALDIALSEENWHLAERLRAYGALTAEEIASGVKSKAMPMSFIFFQEAEKEVTEATPRNASCLVL